MTDSNPRHALYELACRYAQAVDRRNWPRLTTLFTPMPPWPAPASASTTATRSSRACV